MTEFFAIVKVSFYDHFENKSVEEYRAVPCQDFVSAMEIIQDFYREDLESCTIELVAENLLPLTKEAALNILEENGF